jgi:putative transposase
MPFHPSVFSALLKPISRRRFAASVARHDGDAYDKNFSSWDHLAALVFAQLSGVDSLRGLEASWAANAPHHYHLGAGRIVRSTLSDASRRRPAAILAETFADLAGLAGRKLRREGGELVKLIDASPIPLNALHAMRAFNGRIKGAKLHLVHDPDTGLPEAADITPANVNDVSFAHSLAIMPGATYVFDKGYCSFAFWTGIHRAKATFITRAKTNAALEHVCPCGLDAKTVIESNVEACEIVRYASEKAARAGLDFLMRRITVRRENGTRIHILTNDLVRPACDIAALYRRRWRIELLFRWIKQHLRIRRFMGRSENAVKLQIFAALIAYILLRLAAQAARRDDLEPIRFTELVGASLFARKPIARIDKPPPTPASTPHHDPRQMILSLAA